MNISIPLTLLIILSFACTSKEEREAIQTIEQSIEHHGGKDSWSKVQLLSFDKITKLYTETGEIESQVEQHFEFRLKPYFEAKITWEKDSVSHRILFDGIRTTYFMGENEIKNEGFLVNKKKEIDAAFYVMTKPFDLLEGERSKRSEGMQVLPKGDNVLSVQVIDGLKESADLDSWTYYFQPKTHELVGYKVQTSNHISMVYNRSWTIVESLKFPEDRESFRLDEAGNHAYLRATYSYSNYVIQ